jgi:signal transduction histidine kinase
MNLAALFRRNPLVLPMACAAAVAMIVVSEGSYWVSGQALQRLDASARASGGVHGLLQGLVDAEAAQRGYLLRRDPEQLAAYTQAQRDIDRQLDFLNLHFGDNPEAAAVLRRVRTLVDARRARSTNDADATLASTERAQMTALRDLAGELLDFEARAAATGRAELQRTLTLGRIGEALLSAVSLLALCIFLRQTAQLKAQQLALKRGVQQERDRLEDEVRHRTAELTELTRHLQTAREDERHRLARNLHDELGALLTSAKLDAARIRSRLGGTAPEALERLAHLVETLNLSIALGRSIVEDLRPSALSNLGLAPTLSILAREFTERSGVAVECALQPVRLSAAAELTVYRLVQEAITNISKYAQARQVRIRLQVLDGLVDLSVSDDGVGFDSGKRSSSAHGLVGMRSRVEAEGGTLEVLSQPGQGTRLHARLPQSGEATPPL